MKPSADISNNKQHSKYADFILILIIFAMSHDNNICVAMNICLVAGHLDEYIAFKSSSLILEFT